MSRSGDFFYLDAATIAKLVDALIATGMAGNPDTRDDLLNSIHTGYKTDLPNKSSTRHQLESDLEQLNKTQKLDDGQIPLRTWLQNGKRSLERTCRPEASIFNEALQQLEGKLPPDNQATGPDSQHFTVEQLDSAVQRLNLQEEKSPLSYAMRLLKYRDAANRLGHSTLILEIKRKIKELRNDESKQDALFEELVDIAESEESIDFVLLLHQVIQQCVKCENPDAREQLYRVLNLGDAGAYQEPAGWGTTIQAIFDVWRNFKHHHGTRDLVVTAIEKIVDAGGRDAFCQALEDPSNFVLLRDKRLLDIDLCPTQRALKYDLPSVDKVDLRIPGADDRRLHYRFGLEAHSLISIEPKWFGAWQTVMLTPGPLSRKCAVCLFPTNHDATITALAFQEQQQRQSSSLEYLLEDAGNFFNHLVPVRWTFSNHNATQGADLFLAHCARACGDYWLDLVLKTDWLWFALPLDSQEELARLLYWSSPDLSYLKRRFQGVPSQNGQRLRSDLQALWDRICREARVSPPNSNSLARSESLSWICLRPLPPKFDEPERTLLLIHPHPATKTTSPADARLAMETLIEVSDLIEREQIAICTFMAAPDLQPSFEIDHGSIQVVQLEWEPDDLLLFVENYISGANQGIGVSNLFPPSTDRSYLTLLMQLVHRAQGSPVRLLLLLYEAMKQHLRQRGEEAWLDDEDIGNVLRFYKDPFA